MKEVTAVELRQSLGKLARSLERTGEPVLLKLGRRPVAVIISLRDYQERFSLKVAEEARAKLVEEILGDKRAGSVSVEEALDEERLR